MHSKAGSLTSLDVETF